MYPQNRVKWQDINELQKLCFTQHICDPEMFFLNNTLLLKEISPKHFLPCKEPMQHVHNCFQSSCYVIIIQNNFPNLSFGSGEH